jgi:hypothetical protein
LRLRTSGSAGQGFGLQVSRRESRPVDKHDGNLLWIVRPESVRALDLFCGLSSIHMLGHTLREVAAPNVRLFTAYRWENLRPDFVAGISVAAVQIPTAIAYAQLAGFPPLVGLYASILPSVVYALFGSSRQLMVGPDAATCAMVADPRASSGSRSGTLPSALDGARRARWLGLHSCWAVPSWLYRELSLAAYPHWLSQRHGPHYHCGPTRQDSRLQN